MFHDLSSRRPALEEMDKPDIEASALEGALRSLVRINRAGNGAALFWPALKHVLGNLQATRPLRVLDVGCGAGDLSWRLEQRARRAGLALHVDGCDRSPVAIDMARRANESAGGSGQFFVHDAVAGEMPTGYDVIISSLFLHHLENEEAVAVLRQMRAAARHAVVVSDLLRTRFGLLLVYIATRGLSRSPIVHQDGVTSLRAAYTAAEIREIAAAAGLDGARVQRRWPERFLLEWHRG